MPLTAKVTPSDRLCRLNIFSFSHTSQTLENHSGSFIKRFYFTLTQQQTAINFSYRIVPLNATEYCLYVTGKFVDFEKVILFFSYFFPCIKRFMVTTYRHLVLTLRTGGLYLHSSVCIHGVLLN